MTHSHFPTPNDFGLESKHFCQKKNKTFFIHKVKTDEKLGNATNIILQFFNNIYSWKYCIVDTDNLEMRKDISNVQ